MQQRARDLQSALETIIKRVYDLVALRVKTVHELLLVILMALATPDIRDQHCHMFTLMAKCDGSMQSASHDLLDSSRDSDLGHVCIGWRMPTTASAVRL